MGPPKQEGRVRVSVQRVPIGTEGHVTWSGASGLGSTWTGDRLVRPGPCVYVIEKLYMFEKAREWPHCSGTSGLAANAVLATEIIQLCNRGDGASRVCTSRRVMEN